MKLEANDKKNNLVRARGLTLLSRYMLQPIKAGAVHITLAKTSDAAMALMGVNIRGAIPS